MKQILHTLRHLLPHLPQPTRRFLTVFAVVSGLLSIVDVIALMLLAVTLASAVTGAVTSLPVLGPISVSQLPWLIVVLASIVILKSAAGVWLQWIATRRFAVLELEIGQRLFSAYMRAPWTDRLSRNSAQIVQLADTGIANVNAGFILPLTTVPGLLVTSVGVVAVIVVAQPLTALVATVYLGGIAVLQYRVLSPKTRQAARVARDSAMKVSALISGMVAALKEITLRGKTTEVEEVVRVNRARTAQARSNSGFLTAAPRFVFDAAIIGGFVLTGGIAYLAGGMSAAVSAVAMFGIAGFRLVPSLTAFQNVVTRAVTAIPYVDRVIADIDASAEHVAAHERLGREPIARAPRVLELDRVSFAFPGSEVPAVDEVSLRIDMGGTVGIAGASGAGKSTLVDILLGLLSPTSGQILLDGQELTDILVDWRSRVGYVPQEVALFDGTIAQNIALSWGDEPVDMARVEIAARRAQLWDVVERREDGLLTRIGERGLALSGGQRQRLGIARALYSDPLVLVLDEATSALDTKTESSVSEAIRSLEGDVTVIAVAHRLSTIRDSGTIVFMREGRVEAQGSFDDVVARSPEFAEQARLAGLVR